MKPKKFTKKQLYLMKQNAGYSKKTADKQGWDPEKNFTGEIVMELNLTDGKYEIIT